MEKEVSGISSGVSADTLANAWLSVMTRRGFLPRDESVSFNSVSRVTIEIAPASSTSRMVCCCGRIRRPFGAAELDLKDRGRDIYPDLLPEPGLQSVLLIHEHGIRLLC